MGFDEDALIEDTNISPNNWMKTKLEGLIRGEHNLVGKKALIPRTTLKSHFDSIRDV